MAGRECGAGTAARPEARRPVWPGLSFSRKQGDPGWQSLVFWEALGSGRAALCAAVGQRTELTRSRPRSSWLLPSACRPLAWAECEFLKTISYIKRCPALSEIHI